MDILHTILRFGSLAIVVGAFSSALFLLFGRTCSRRQGKVCAAFICSYIGIVVWDTSTIPEVEWNPLDLAEEELLGTWSDEQETVVLGADGVFSHHTPTRSDAGVWRRDDWNLYLNGKTMRFVRHKGRSRLMTNPPGDPDGWDRNVGLPKVAEPKVPGKEAAIGSNFRGVPPPKIR